jgi:hypothetical protein
LIYSFWLPLWYLQTFDHYIVCPSLIYSFWLPLWYLQTVDHYIVCPSLGVIRSCKSKKDRQHNGQKFEDTKGVIRSRKSKKDTFDLQLLITPLVSSNFWPFCCLSFFDLHFWLPFGIFKLLTILLSFLWFTASDYPFGIFKLLTDNRMVKS